MVSASKAGVVVAVVVEEMAAEPGPVRAGPTAMAAEPLEEPAREMRTAHAGMNAAARPPVVEERARIMAATAKDAAGTVTTPLIMGGLTALSA